MTTTSELKELFLEAVELPAPERRAFLSELASRDPRLWRRVAGLVAAHERAEVAYEAAEVAVAGAVGDLEASAPELPLCLGNYELSEELASGGSGIVYRARQLDLGRTVAIKLLRSGRLATEDEVQRFHAEAEVSARLDHPAIVPVYEVGTHEGRHFISMKLIDGPSLDRSVERFHEDPRAAAELVAKIARAVDHGHRHGVLHRDLKPSNVLLDGTGAPYVADFGTAKLVDGAVRRTVTGWILGTPSYMAPEQAAGTDVTVATDVYALGAILYELLVGHPPFAAAGIVETLRRVREEAPPAVRAARSTIDRDLETICHTCLAKEPARRYGSALELAEDLERWLAFEPIHARPSTRVERLWLTWRRKPLVAGLVAAVAVLAIALGAGSVVAGFELSDRLERTRAAEDVAREQLRNAFLAEARAVRQGGETGRRTRALELLREAAAIRPGADVLNEGIASLALTDLVTERLWRRNDADNLHAFDAAFRRQVVARLDGEVELRSGDDDRILATLPGNGHPAWRARFSPDGRYLCLVHHVHASHREPLLVVHDLDRMEQVFSVEALPAGAVDFAPDRPVVALCWNDGRLHERDLETLGDRTITTFDPDDLPRVIRYAPDGASIAVAGQEPGRVRIFSLDGELVGVLEGGDDVHDSLTWSPDGARLAAACHDHRAYVWDVGTGERIAKLVGHRSEVVAVAFPERDLVATSSWDGTTRLWDVRTAGELCSSEERLVDSPPTAGRLALATFDQVRVAAVADGSALRTLHGHAGKDPDCLAVAPDGRRVVSGGMDELLLWDLASGRRLDAVEREDVTELLFHPDGTLFVGSTGGLEGLAVEGDRFADGSVELVPDRCKSVAQSSDGGLVAALGGGRIHLFRRGDRQGPRWIDSALGASSLALDPEGRWVAAGSYRGAGVHVWRATDGVLEAHLAPGEAYCKVDLSPDGRRLAFGTLREYHVHSVGTWELEYRVPRDGSNNATAKVTRFSPDGTLLAATLDRWRVGLLDAETGGVLAVLEPPDRQPPNEARFTPDGRQLLVATASNRVLVWDLERLRDELAVAGLDASLGPGWSPPSRTGN